MSKVFRGRFRADRPEKPDPAIAAAIANDQDRAAIAAAMTNPVRGRFRTGRPEAEPADAQQEVLQAIKPLPNPPTREELLAMIAAAREGLEYLGSFGTGASELSAVETALDGMTAFLVKDASQ